MSCRSPVINGLGMNWIPFRGLQVGSCDLVQPLKQDLGVFRSQFSPPYSWAGVYPMEGDDPPYSFPPPIGLRAQRMLSDECGRLFSIGMLFEPRCAEIPPSS